MIARTMVAAALALMFSGVAGCALDTDDAPEALAAGAAGQVDAGAPDAADHDASAPDAAAPDAFAPVPDAFAPVPDAFAPCVAWVDHCHVRACPGGEVTERPDGATCPQSACPTGGDVGAACSCRAGECAWE